MKRKVQRISSYITDQLQMIDGVATITLHESAESDINDPYFFLSLDVYYQGALPDAGRRQSLFEDTGGFETSSYSTKDRFFMEKLPVRIEYKHITRVEHLLQNVDENLWAFRETGTYMFYRLSKGSVLYEDGDWLNQIRSQLSKLPHNFWEALREAYFYSAEHYLVDLKSAVLQKDDLFYLISLSGFIKSICSFLFALNHRFEPSGRQLFQQTLALDTLPENFRGRFHSILREDPEYPPERKQEIAELMTRSMINLM